MIVITLYSEAAILLNTLEYTATPRNGDGTPIPLTTLSSNGQRTGVPPMEENATYLPLLQVNINLASYNRFLVL